MDVEELIEKARDQRRRERYEEAVISAKAATVQDGVWGAMEPKTNVSTN